MATLFSIVETAGRGLKFKKRAGLYAPVHLKEFEQKTPRFFLLLLFALFFAQLMLMPDDTSTDQPKGIALMCIRGLFFHILPSLKPEAYSEGGLWCR